jgi:hypothetical protein
MNAVYNLREVLLLIEVSQFENEALFSISVLTHEQGDWHTPPEGRHAGQN